MTAMKVMAGGWLGNVGRGDARVVTATIITLLAVASVLVQLSDRERQLEGVLTRLSPEVRLALLPARPDTAAADASADFSATRQLIGNIFNLQHTELPDAVSPLAIFTLDSPRGVQEVLLFDRAVAKRFSLTGERIGAFVAVGAAAPRLLSPGHEPDTLSPEVRGFLRRSAHSTRILVQPSWALRRVPALASLAPSNDTLVGLSASRDPSRIHLEGLIPKPVDAAWPATRTFFRHVPEEALLLFDGVPVTQLLPDKLPPLIGALLSESGVSAELRDLARLFREETAAVVLEQNPDELHSLSVGLSLPPQVGTEEVVEAVRVLFTKRLALAGPVTERLRINGRTIIHQRLRREVARSPAAPNVTSALEETRYGARRILKAPLAAGAADLVAVFDKETVVIGTSRETAERAADRLRSSARGPDSGEVRLFLDGIRTRHLPAVTLALRGLDERLRPWAESARTVLLRLRAGTESLHLSADLEIGP